MPSSPLTLLPRYLAEWYRSDVTEDLLEHTAAKINEYATLNSVETVAVRLLMTLSVPTDEVIFCLFAATSAESVLQVCQQAGFPPERVSDAIEVSHP